MTVPVRQGVALLLVAFAAVGCAEGNRPFEAATPDEQLFEQQVWPVLVRDCGFPACHGDPVRFFYVVGPGHVRLDPEMDLDEPVTEAELRVSYDRARSMVDVEQPDKSLLLKKPLEVDAGGSLHEGTDSFGRDVYPSDDDEAYRLLRQWARSLEAAP